MSSTDCGFRTLHEPTGNDSRLFKLIWQHFESEAYYRLLELNVRRPQLGLGATIGHAKEAYNSLGQLCVLATEADRVVKYLEREFKSVMDLRSRVKAVTLSYYEQKADDKLELLKPTAYQPPAEGAITRVNTAFSKSFGVAEEELLRRGHARAATFSETAYTAASESTNKSQPKADLPDRNVGQHRRGIHVPRIFTGSFSQLEDDIRRLHIDKVHTPVTQHIEGDDLGATPVVSPCPSPRERKSQQCNAPPAQPVKTNRQAAYAQGPQSNPPVA